MAEADRVRAPRQLRAGFTLVEITISAVIFLILTGIVFEMYTKGSKAGAKATWRAQVTGRSRAGIRQIKEAIDGSSYPSVVSFTDYRETTTAYIFDLEAPTSSVVGTTTTTHSYSAQGTVATWYACHPIVPPVMAAPGTPNGVGTQFVLKLEPSTLYPSSRLDLVMDISSGPVQDTPPDVTIGTLVLLESRRLVTEVERLDLTVPTNSAPGNNVVGIRITCRDPIDGYMRVVEESRANANVAIPSP